MGYDGQVGFYAAQGDGGAKKGVGACETLPS